MNVEIIIENDNWNSKEIEKLINDATKAVFSYLKLQNDDIEISVLCTDDEGIRVLNKTYRGVDSATNVLSFPMESDLEYDDFDYDGFDFDKDVPSNLYEDDASSEDEECDCGEECHCCNCSDLNCGCHKKSSENNCILGCTAFAYETIDRESKEQGKNFDDHIKHLVVHSVLHLLGYDHIENEEAEKMEDLEVKILQTLGVNDPYKERE